MLNSSIKLPVSSNEKMQEGSSQTTEMRKCRKYRQLRGPKLAAWG